MPILCLAAPEKRLDEFFEWISFLRLRSLKGGREWQHRTSPPLGAVALWRCGLSATWGRQRDESTPKVRQPHSKGVFSDKCSSIFDCVDSSSSWNAILFNGVKISSFGFISTSVSPSEFSCRLWPIVHSLGAKCMLGGCLCGTLHPTFPIERNIPKRCFLYVRDAHLTVYSTCKFYWNGMQFSLILSAVLPTSISSSTLVTAMTYHSPCFHFSSRLVSGNFRGH